MKSQTLYQKTKTGAINCWRVWTEGNILYTEFGQLNGKMQTTVGKVCIGTNIGKSNERTPEQQAEFEAESMFKDQLRLKYSLTIEDSHNVRIQPLLANDGHKAILKFPLDVQTKYDGGRCLTKDGDRVLYSRGNKTYSVQHITEELKAMFPSDMMTDGELYIHGVPLQKIMSLIKKPQLQSNDIEYHIYDIPSDKSWNERKKILNSFKSSGHIKIVETYIANNMEELVALHDRFVENGFEGAIIRVNDPEIGYEFGKRSRLLLKWKAFEDKEFLIVGIGVGKGKYSECPIFSCKNDINDKTFDVVPIGTMEMKKEMLDNSNIGKLLTVKFLGRSEDGIPKIAVGKVIRTIEDLPQKEKNYE